MQYSLNLFWTVSNWVLFWPIIVSIFSLYFFRSRVCLSFDFNNSESFLFINSKKGFKLSYGQELPINPGTFKLLLMTLSYLKHASFKSLSNKFNLISIFDMLSSILCLICWSKASNLWDVSFSCIWFDKVSKRVLISLNLFSIFWFCWSMKSVVCAIFSFILVSTFLTSVRISFWKKRKSFLTLSLLLFIFYF